MASFEKRSILPESSRVRSTVLEHKPGRNTC
jgi:hypothetical protein